MPGILIRIGADTKDAIDGINKVEKALGQSMTPMQKFGHMAKNVLGPALLGVAAAAGTMAVAFAVEGVKAAAEEEAELAKLAKTLTNLGFGDATASVNAFIDAQARATTFSDSDLRPSLAALAQATGDVAAAQDLLTLAMDASVGSGKELDSVSQALAKAANGNTTSLQKMFPWLDKNRLATEGMDYATQALAERFKGQAASAADTWTGKLGNLTEAFGELQESFGKGFLEGLDQAEQGGMDLTESLYAMQDSVEELGKELGTFLSDLLTLITEIKNANQAFQDWRKTLEGTPWGKILDTIALAFERLTSPLRGILELIEGIKAGIAALQNVSIPSIPGLSSASVATAGASTRSSAPTYNITVTGAVDPVGVSRQIKRILATGDMRSGRGA